VDDWENRVSVEGRVTIPVRTDKIRVLVVVTVHRGVCSWTTKQVRNRSLPFFVEPRPLIRFGDSCRSRV
jgi:hypothetical protein